jgi:hypothetical protein
VTTSSAFLFVRFAFYETTSSFRSYGIFNIFVALHFPKPVDVFVSLIRLVHRALISFLIFLSILLHHRAPLRRSLQRSWIFAAELIKLPQMPVIHQWRCVKSGALLQRRVSAWRILRLRLPCELLRWNLQSLPLRVKRKLLPTVLYCFLFKCMRYIQTARFATASG